MNGCATFDSEDFTPPKAPIATGTFFPPVMTPRRSPRLTTKRLASGQPNGASPRAAPVQDILEIVTP